MTATILQGDVFEQLPTIQPGSVACCVTSPPYWQLRRYLPVGHPLAHLEIGQEKTPGEYVDKIVRVLSLVREALANHGTCWVNVGDTYTHSRGKRKPGDKHGPKQLSNEGSYAMPSATVEGLEESNLCLIPQRLMLALQDDGWIVRSVVCWQKPAPMPCSVKGWQWMRCRVKEASGHRSVEKKAVTTNGKPHGGRDANGKDFASKAAWTDCPGCKRCNATGGYVLRKGSWRPTSSYEPIIMLAKTADYFADGEPVKTASAPATISRDKYTRVLDDADEQFAAKHDHDEWGQGGANLRDVWRIAAEPLREAHYAAYPSELVRLCLQSSVSEKGYCPACGKPWVRVIESKSVAHPNPRASGREAVDTKGGNQANGSASLAPETQTVGWRASCKCDAGEPRPGLVLDPFTGSGRTAIAAQRLGLDFVGCELNPEYAGMAERIVYDDAPLFT